MKKKIQRFFPLIVAAFALLLLMQCTKENLVEPVDPFESQKLDPDAVEIQMGTGPNAIMLKTNKSNVIQTNYGMRIKGSLYVENPMYGDIRLSNGDFDLTKDANGNYVTNLTGTALPELPHEGLLSKLNMLGLSATSLGIKKGSDFDTGAFGWPVDNDRYYFYFENGSPLSAEISKSSLVNIKKFAIDPLDPYFFTSCDFNGTKLGDLSDVGLAISAQGFIPFTPIIPDYGVPSFNGNIYLSGSIPIGKYPVTFHGEAVVGFNTKNPKTDDFFNGTTSPFQAGFNGKATFDNKALDWLNVEVVLGSACLYLNVDNSGNTELDFVGQREMPPTTVSDFLNQIIGKDWNFLDYLVPISQKETLYGTIGNELSNWKLGFKMESSLNIPNYGSINMGSAELEINSNSMYFAGEAPVAVFGHVGVKGYANKNGDFELTGYNHIGLNASKGALSLSFNMSMDVTVKHVSGTFTFEGDVKLGGKACVSIGKIDICAGFTIHASVTVSSNGNFKVCFSIGVGKLGFDVCLSYTKSSAVAAGYIQEMTYNEIPLEQVPLQNRFNAVEYPNAEK